MIYLSLFWEFLKIGMFSFGGAYGAIPLIQESILSNGWMNKSMFSNMIAISESTPGPIMINAATYIGNSQGDIFGAIIATIGVILPSFFIILVITALLRNFLKNRNIQAILNGIQPCLMGIILATGFYMVYDVIFHSHLSGIVEWKAVLILGILMVCSYIYRKKKHTEISPIVLIVVAAVLGGMLY